MKVLKIAQCVRLLVFAVSIFSIPGPTKTQVFVRFSFKMVLYGATAYMAYRVGSRIVAKVQSMMKS